MGKYNKDISVRMLPKGKGLKLSTNFNQREIDCSCIYPDCNVTLVVPLLMVKAQLVRGLWGRTVKVNSGYRCQRHNADVGGSETSMHMLGIGLDLAPERKEDMDDFESLCNKIFDYVIRYDTFCHCDIRLQI